jgi:rod shape-determining protein MreC
LDPLGTTIIIDRGSADGLTNGHPVIVGNGLLIGKLVRVDEHTSVVRLLSDYQSRVAATVVNREKSLGLVEGGYGLTVKLDLIPQNEVIRPGDVIITSGLEAYIPRGLVIGTVEVVEKKTQEPFQQAIIKTAADLHSITLVSILL